jgi:hypothetical protein
MTDAPDLPVAPDPAGDDSSDPLKRLSKAGLTGSKCPYFTQHLMNQLVPTLPSFGPRGEIENIVTAVSVLAEIRPRSVLEGMLASQMAAVHAAAMETLRRANLAGQTFEARAMNLAQASKLTRSYVALLEALDKHRGKGQQTVRVEHVHVHSGGQAIVDAVSQRGGGGDTRNNKQPRAPAALAHEPSPTLRRPDPERQPMPVAGDEG